MCVLMSLCLCTNPALFYSSSWFLLTMSPLLSYVLIPSPSPHHRQNVRTSAAGSTYPGIGVGGLTTLKILDTGPGIRIRPAQGLHSYNYKFISAIKERKLLMPNDSSKSSANSSSKTLSTAESRPSSSNGLPTHTRSTVDPGSDLQEQLKTAEDSLLLAQLDAGRIPSEFLQKASYSSHLQVTVDLSNFGIGDTHGLCLAQG